jgi:3-isopropylmalate/(R)-2-methylmalate dehydratase small subunit
LPKAWVYGDNIDTDVIIPARYLLTTDPVVLGKHVLEDLDPSFATSVGPGDVVVAGHNFGCGSSREHAPLALKGAGVSAVVAASFARIFFRNAINVGLPIITCADAAEAIETGDEVAVDPETGDLLDVSRDQRFCGEQLPDLVVEIIETGGLVEWVKHHLEVAR